jgi:hypothetical protein
VAAGKPRSVGKDPWPDDHGKNQDVPWCRRPKITPFWGVWLVIPRNGQYWVNNWSRWGFHKWRYPKWMVYSVKDN